MSLANIKTKVTDSTAVGKVENFLNENGPTVSMIGSLIMLGVAIFSAFKASEKVAQIKSDYEAKVQEIEAEPLPEAPESDSEESDDAVAIEAEIEAILKDKSERVKELKTFRNVLYILAYKWVLAGGTIAALLMLLCNYLNGAKIATVTAALALSEDKVKKTIKSAKEMFPDSKVAELEDKTLEKLVSRNFADDGGAPVIMKPMTKDPNIGDIYVDSYTGFQFQFRGTEKELLEVFDRASDYCYRCHGLPISKFWSMLGQPTPYCAWGNWGPNLPFKAHIEKRDLCGATFKVIVYDYEPGTLKDAGCPTR